jgi:RNA polymerase sigma-70 factor (ECF subfamily)
MAKHARGEDNEMQLVAELRDWGSESAFRRLHRQHTPRLVQLIRRMLGGDYSDAEDLVQETWIRGVKNLPSFRGDSAFGTWLVRICIHVTQDFLRKAKRLPLSVDEVLELSMPEAPIAERIDIGDVIGLLPPGYRAVLLLHDVEGFTHSEIADMLGIAEGTSKSQLNAARELAQNLFDGTRRSSATTLTRRSLDSAQSTASWRYLET